MKTLMRLAGSMCFALMSLHAQSALADPIVFSTTGRFELPTGTAELIGVNGAPGESEDYYVGEVPYHMGDAGAHNTPFHLRFEFNGGLPAIEVSGTVRFMGYNLGVLVENPVVTSTADLSQQNLYPTFFQEMLAHPEWLRTNSFSTSEPTDTTTLAFSVQLRPFDPNDPELIPEPSTALVFATGLLGAAGWNWRRRRRS